MNKGKFWETKSLGELNHFEWEALCDGCAKCCIRRKRSGEVVESINIGSFCYLLDAEPCRCSSYANRKELKPTCIVLSPDHPELFEQMPLTCAYRLIHEGKPLPDWHPLVSKDPDTALPHKAFVNGKLNLLHAAPKTSSAPGQLHQSIPITPTIRKVEENVHREVTKDKDTTVSPMNASSADNTFVRMSHKVRTDLNNITGAAQLLADASLPNDLRVHINTILSSSSELLDSIGHVFDITALGYGQLAIHEAPLNLNSVCNSIDCLLRPHAEQQQVDFQCACENDVPISVLCDKRLLIYVMENLLRSALDRTFGGSISLGISCKKRGARGALILFRMIDTGSLIHERQQAILRSNYGDLNDKDPIQQLRDNLGMDMVICRKIIEGMGGDIDVVSNEGTENTVSITIPLHQANNPEFIIVDRNKTITKPNARVLLAEDNKLNRHVVVSILKAAGCEVIAVNNGKEAVKEAHKTHFDLVLMDCQMPIMDGFEATNQIRAMDAPINSLPIIALTAMAMKGDKEKCLANGMSGYLSKPIDRQMLIDIINKHLSVK